MAYFLATRTYKLNHENRTSGQSSRFCPRRIISSFGNFTASPSRSLFLY
jgi:hypothetical protein